jgi:hypothetical protein
MEQSKAMEYESRKALSDVLKPRNIITIFKGKYKHTLNNTERLLLLIVVGNTLCIDNSTHCYISNAKLNTYC